MMIETGLVLDSSSLGAKISSEGPSLAQISVKSNGLGVTLLQVSFSTGDSA